VSWFNSDFNSFTTVCGVQSLIEGPSRLQRKGKRTDVGDLFGHHESAIRKAGLIQVSSRGKGQMHLLGTTNQHLDSSPQLDLINTKEDVRKKKRAKNKNEI